MHQKAGVRRERSQRVQFFAADFGEEHVASVLLQAVAAGVDKALITDLTTAAGAAKADVDAALAAIASWPGQRILATGSVIGAADLLAAADFSNGSLSVLFDTNLGATNLAIAVEGVAYSATAVVSVSAVNPTILAVEAAGYSTVFGPFCATGSVAAW